MIPGIDAYDLDITIDEHEINQLLAVRPADVDATAEFSFARNIFIPLTTACRYTCTYCTYYDPPGQAELMSPEEVRDVCARGADAGCTEALFTFGDDPDERYTSIYDQLNEWGHNSVHTYLREVCEIALDEGLLPHANPGDQTREQMEIVANVNASMGVMLETTADVQAHSGPQAKNPGQRLNTLQIAGELGVPFTTGVLVGIGEDWTDRAVSILAIRKLHERYGHIQEFIVQSVAENERWQGVTPDLDSLRRVTAMVRAGLPPEVSVQVPPNLAPTEDLIDCGINDLGGVSPVTEDHINPEYTWPALQELEELADYAGVPLRERLPVYERFIDENTGSGKWAPGPIRDAIAADDIHGERFRSILETGKNPVDV